MSTKAAYIDDKSDPDEWEVAWDKLAEKFGSYDCCDPSTHELWQYMGSWQAGVDGEWKHGFRHRSLPPQREHVYWNCPASPGWRPRRTFDMSTNECPPF
jgi:hypothetical protein